MAGAGSTALLGVGRGAISVILGDTGVAQYNPNTDKIYIREDEAWGPAGAFTVSYEYGHAVHEKALRSYGDSGCPRPHRLSDPTSLKCAFVEGFADFHGVAALPPVVTGSYRDLLEATWAHYGTGWYFGGDGSAIESTVGAFMWDLVDVANESGDNTTYPGSYLGSIIRTCNISYGGSYQPANGIDGVVYCLERGVDQAVVMSYFVSRWPKPTAQSNTAALPGTWNASSIRALWLHDLYGI